LGHTSHGTLSLCSILALKLVLDSISIGTGRRLFPSWVTISCRAYPFPLSFGCPLLHSGLVLKPPNRAGSYLKFTHCLFLYESFPMFCPHFSQPDSDASFGGTSGPSLDARPLPENVDSLNFFAVHSPYIRRPRDLSRAFNASPINAMVCCEAPDFLEKCVFYYCLLRTMTRNVIGYKCGDSTLIFP